MHLEFCSHLNTACLNWFTNSLEQTIFNYNDYRRTKSEEDKILIANIASEISTGKQRALRNLNLKAGSQGFENLCVPSRYVRIKHETFEGRNQQFDELEQIPQKDRRQKPSE